MRGLRRSLKINFNPKSLHSAEIVAQRRKCAKKALHPILTQYRTSSLSLNTPLYIGNNSATSPMSQPIRIEHDHTTRVVRIEHDSRRPKRIHGFKTLLGSRILKQEGLEYPPLPTRSAHSLTTDGLLAFDRIFRCDIIYCNDCWYFVIKSLGKMFPIF